MRSGKCSKCGEEDVIPDVTMYTAAGAVRARARPVFFAPETTMSMWVCAKCGYSEVYVKDPGKLRK